MLDGGPSFLCRSQNIALCSFFVIGRTVYSLLGIKYDAVSDVRADLLDGLKVMQSASMHHHCLSLHRKLEVVKQIMASESCAHSLHGAEVPGGTRATYSLS